jgi:hypothetical protein
VFIFCNVTLFYTSSTGFFLLFLLFFRRGRELALFYIRVDGEAFGISEMEKVHTSRSLRVRKTLKTCESGGGSHGPDCQSRQVTCSQGRGLCGVCMVVGKVAEVKEIAVSRHALKPPSSRERVALHSW